MTVSSGTLAFTNGTAATVSGNVSVTVGAGATLQLAGYAAALSNADGFCAANITTQHGTSPTADGAVYVSGTTTQTVGTISSGTSGQVMDSNMTPATVYFGNTTVGDGMNAANLTATQILQNSLTINANSTVTIAPSDPSTGGACRRFRPPLECER